MRILFQVCFGVGLGYSVISFVLGQILGNFTGGHADAGGSADIDLDLSADAGVDFDAGADLDAGHGASSVSPFKPTVIAAFLAVFGGIGMITLPLAGVYLAFTVSAAAGLVAGYVIYRYVYTFLYNAQNTSTVDKQSLVGSAAKVTEYIPPGKYGKITYVVKGGTYTAPAKSEDGGEISRGTEVEIISIIKNTYYVKKRFIQ